MGILKRVAKKLIYNTLPSSHVLMFHHVTAKPEIPQSGCLLDYEKFRDFVLRFQGRYATLEDVVKKRAKHKIAITFDDGLADLHTLAYPFLKERGIPFTAFIITDFIDKPGYITTQQLKEMSCDPLVTIGSHGVTHELLPNLDTEQKQRELCESQKKLQEITGRKIDIFAYSHGKFDRETLNLMRCYDYGMSVKGAPLNCLTFRKYLIPRFNIDATTFEKMSALFKKQILDI